MLSPCQGQGILGNVDMRSIKGYCRVSLCSFALSRPLLERPHLS